MRARGGLAALAAAALVIGPSAGAAQLRVGAAGGPVYPTGGFSDALDSGVHGGVVVELGAPTVPLGLRADFSWLKLGGAAAAPDFRQLHGSLGLRLDLVPIPFLDAYLIAGGGAYASDYPGESAPPAGWVTDPGLNVGVGTALNLILVKAFVELRYHHVFGSPSRTFLPLGVGLLFP